ncbi:hypothetical protein ABTY53_01330 [Streptomyces noursei]|uniref:hypothetical protein n=1 Tax=Streptomyces noursei TaxID=1971 RepID=UPI003323A733
MDLMQLAGGAGFDAIAALICAMAIIAVADPDPEFRERAFRVLRIMLFRRE